MFEEKHAFTSIPALAAVARTAFVQRNADGPSPSFFERSGTNTTLEQTHVLVSMQALSVLQRNHFRNNASDKFLSVMVNAADIRHTAFRNTSHPKMRARHTQMVRGAWVETQRLRNCSFRNGHQPFSEEGLDIGCVAGACRCSGDALCRCLHGRCFSLNLGHPFHVPWSLGFVILAVAPPHVLRVTLLLCGSTHVPFQWCCVFGILPCAVI